MRHETLLLCCSAVVGGARSLPTQSATGPLRSAGLPKTYFRNDLSATLTRFFGGLVFTVGSEFPLQEFRFITLVSELMSQSSRF